MRRAGVHVVTNVRPWCIHADPDRLAPALRTPVDNAVRHATSTVDLHLRAASGQAVLDVADDDPGIPETQRERVVERFIRLDESRTRAAGRTGPRREPQRAPPGRGRAAPACARRRRADGHCPCPRSSRHCGQTVRPTCRKRLASRARADQALVVIPSIGTPLPKPHQEGAAPPLERRAEGSAMVGPRGPVHAQLVLRDLRSCAG